MPRLPSPASSPAPRRIPTCSRCSSSGAAPAATLPPARTSTSAWCSGGEPRADRDRAEKRLKYLAEADLDLAVFHSLPLHIRSRVLKDGTVLYARDEAALYPALFTSACSASSAPPHPVPLPLRGRGDRNANSRARVPRPMHPLTLSLSPSGGEGIEMSPSPSPSERERVGVRVALSSA